MLDAILNLLGGGALGGLFGIAGAWLKGREERAKLELEFNHRKAMRKIDLEEMTREADLRLKQTEVELAGRQAIASTEAEAAMEVAAGKALEASYTADKATYGGGWADKLRGAMRPVITIYLLAVLSLVAVKLYGLQDLTSTAPAEAWTLFSEVVRDIVFLAITATLWWFGSRPNNRSR